MLKIINWNVNSIKSRISHLITLIKKENPDIIMLQELKCESHKFPYLELEEFGYNTVISGQKTYNGVAILSKHPIEEQTLILPSYDIDDNDTQARYVEITCSINHQIWRFISVYVPNGQEVSSDKYKYKLKFFERLHTHLNILNTYQEKIIIGGDFNVANQDIDVYHPASFIDKICFSQKEKTALRKIINSGFLDNYRILNPYEQQFSWWDYRANSYKQNKGLRIDYFFSNTLALNHLKKSETLEYYRDLKKPSDHAPICTHYDNTNNQ